MTDVENFDDWVNDVDDVSSGYPYACVENEVEEGIDDEE